MKIIKTLALVAVLTLVIAAAVSCQLPGSQTEATTTTTTEPACEHMWTAATCETPKTCVLCNEIEGEARGHEIVLDPAVDATCETAGLTAGEHCTKCDYVVAQEEVAALGHTAGEVAVENEVAADCVTAGSYDKVVYCTVCTVEISRTTVVVDALGHKYTTSYTWSDDNSTCTANKVCANDATHAASETATVSTVVLNVTATKVTYTYNVEFANSEFAAQTKTVDASVALENSIATINAPAIAGRVASHDYVKFGFHDAAATYTFTIYYSEVDVWDGVSVSASLAGSGTLEDPFLIQSGADLAYIAQVVNALEVKTAAFSGQYFVMTKSIDLNGHALHIGTGSAWGTRQIFAGCLDGNNRSIRGINNTLSLFGCVGYSDEQKRKSSKVQEVLESFFPITDNNKNVILSKTK